MRNLFDDSCFLQSGERAVLIDSLQAAGGDLKGEKLLELRDPDLLFLQVRVAPGFPGRVELRCTGPV